MKPIIYTPESTFCLITVFLCLLTGLILFVFSKHGNKANIFLGWSYLVFGFGFLIVFLIFSHLIFYFPYLYRTGNIFFLLYMPFTYLYMRTTITQKKLTWLDLLHLIPVLIYVTDYLPFFLMPVSGKIAAINDDIYDLNRLIEFKESWLFHGNIHIPMRVIQMTIYWILEVRLLTGLDRSVRRQNRNWIRWQIIHILLQLFIFLPALVVLVSGRSSYAWSVSIPPAVGILLSTITLYLYPQILYNIKMGAEKNKNGKPKLSFSEEYIERVELQLAKHMQEKKPFLQPHYSLKDLADDLGILPHHLSAFINQVEGMNLSDYMNRWRIQFCLELMRQGETANLNLHGIALKCGFSNRNTFSIAFKKFIGETPSEYLRLNSLL